MSDKVLWCLYDPPVSVIESSLETDADCCVYVAS